MKKKQKIFSALRHLFLFIIIMWGIPACYIVGPNYVTPTSNIPEKWKNNTKNNILITNRNNENLAAWWKNLNDEKLTKLVELAIKGNPDIRKASSRTFEARARRGIDDAKLYPDISASGFFNRGRSSINAGTGKENDLYSTGFDASWELDFFGGNRRSIEATQADLEASLEDFYDVKVTLISEVALNYIEALLYQNRLIIAKENFDIQENTLQIARWRNDAGLATQLDVEEASYNLETTRAQIFSLQTGLGQAKNRLSTLVGLNPGGVDDELSGLEKLPVVNIDIAIGIPADILRNRPDVRRAERQLAAQTARIGVATSELYPKFTLSGTIGLEALTERKFFDFSSRTYSWGPKFGWNIFNAGSIRQNIKVQTELQKQALISYESAVLTALRDVENAVIAFSDDQKREEALIKAADSMKITADIYLNEYTSGLADFKPVLDAQRSLLSVQDQLIQTRADVISDIIRLYKALGGGWETIKPDNFMEKSATVEKVNEK